MQIRVVIIGNLFYIERLTNSFLGNPKWKRGTAQSFLSLEEAENWIKENLFPITAEVVAHYSDNTKTPLI